MPKLPPISVPFVRRWHEFRFQYLPFVTFGVVVVASVALWAEFAVPKRSPAASADSTSLDVPSETTHGAMATVAHVAPDPINTNSVASGFSD